MRKPTWNKLKMFLQIISFHKIREKYIPQPKFPSQRAAKP